MIIERACVLPFVLGGLIGSTFGSAIACTMWFFDTVEFQEALELAKSRSALPEEEKRTVNYKGRIRHMGYGMDVVEIRV